MEERSGVEEEKRKRGEEEKRRRGEEEKRSGARGGEEERRRRSTSDSRSPCGPHRDFAPKCQSLILLLQFSIFMTNVNVSNEEKGIL